MNTDRELIDLMSCSGAPHWPVFQPTITALRKRLANPEMQPCTGRNCGSTNPNLQRAIEQALTEKNGGHSAA
jgi:hypothetical protein